MISYTVRADIATCCTGMQIDEALLVLQYYFGKNKYLNYKIVRI